MAAPIDEGAPTYTSRSGSNFTLGNVTADFRMHVLDQSANDEVDLQVWYASAPDLHNITDVRVATSVSSWLEWNLHMLNAIGYHDQPVTKVLLDFLIHQAHAGHGHLRLLPSGDKGINNWTPSSGSSAHYTYVDEYADEVVTGNFLHTLAANTAEEFDLASLPSNAVFAHEAFIRAWIAMTVGTDTGMGVRFALRDSGGTPIAPLQIVDSPTTGTTAVFRQAKMDRMNTSPATWAGAYLEVYSLRGAPGFTPNPHWYLYSVEVMLFYEISDIVIVRASTFTALDAEHAAYLLDCTLARGTYRSALMDILAHAPHLLLYSDYGGAIACAKILDYSTVSTPFDLTPYIIDVRGPYKFIERTANAIAVTRWLHIENRAQLTAAEDPYTTDGTRKLTRWTPGPSLADNDFKEMKRPMISTLAMHNNFMDRYMGFYKTSPDAVELTCTLPALEVEPGDVVALTRSDIGFIARKMAVVEKSIDYNNELVLLTLYDLNNTF